MGEVILAQRNEDAIVAPREIETLGGGFVLLDLRFERLRRAIFDQVGEVLDELRCARAAEIIALSEREDLLELVEDHQRDERVAGIVAQEIVAMMQELPQRFAGNRHTRTRPPARMLRRTEDRLLDLFRWRR